MDFRRKSPALSPTHYHEQHCGLQWSHSVPGNHHLSGPEVGHSHRLHREKGPAENVLSSSTEKVQPATGAHDTVLLAVIESVLCFFYNCMVWVSHQIRYKKTAADSLGQQKGSLVCTCPAFRICTTPE